jgi:acyl-CoA ligase (AMP-forming) (exosortase A-associated)
MPAALVHELLLHSALKQADAPALHFREATFSYADFAHEVEALAQGLLARGLASGERVAVYLPKQPEMVTTLFATAAAGLTFVPVNPLLKPAQLVHILADCNVRVLVSSAARLQLLLPLLAECPDLQTLVYVDEPCTDAPAQAAMITYMALRAAEGARRPHRRIDTDMAAILYTSGSTGKPKGVVLSHRNVVAGAHSVASYLENRASDRLLAVLPLSFDAGLSQLTTAFSVGASAALMDYLLPRDVIRAVERYAITGLAAVPPLWNQLAELAWPDAARRTLRYLTNTGGAMPVATTRRLRSALPQTQIYLMYGLTEAFRSTYLPPAEVDRRPDSIGKAIPNAEILVLREDGSECAPDEPGELVHRGALVTMGYWNDPAKTAERFRPIPPRADGLVLSELAVWSGDQVRRDADGFLYFIGRKDEMIKTSGYRVSPTEVEEVLYQVPGVAEVAVVGLPHPMLGQAIVALLRPADGAPDPSEAAVAECRRALPNFMVPARILLRESLPRNQNGKIDRRALAAELTELFTEENA